MESTDAKILFLDIETSPALGWVWAKWQTNVVEFKNDWYILSFAYKWAGQKKVTKLGLIDYTTYRVDPENDYALVKELWNLIDDADIIVAHNGDSFDLVKINTRFLIHGFTPPSPYRTVDTLKIARKVFAFDSNKLDDLSHSLGIGRKLPHPGFHLWKGCMTGDAASWKLMKDYNGHDVELLESLYYQIRQWAPQHANVNKGKIENCPRCGSSRTQRRGFTYTALRKKQRFQCLACSGWFEGPARKVK